MLSYVILAPNCASITIMLVKDGVREELIEAPPSPPIASAIAQRLAARHGVPVVGRTWRAADAG